MLMRMWAASLALNKIAYMLLFFATQITSYSLTSETEATILGVGFAGLTPAKHGEEGAAIPL